MEPNSILKPYSKTYSDKKFWKKIAEKAKSMGVDVTFCALILFYTLNAKTTPFKDKAIIIAALGYLVAPIDLIPDLVPLGFSDDLAVFCGLFLGVNNIKGDISPAIINNAKKKFLSLPVFSNVRETTLDELVLKWKLNELDKSE